MQRVSPLCAPEADTEAGYRYLNLRSGKDGNRDNAIADGPYVKANASF